MQKLSVALVEQRLGVTIHPRGFRAKLRQLLRELSRDEDSEEVAAILAAAKELTAHFIPDGYFELPSEDERPCLVALEVEDNHKMPEWKCQKYCDLAGEFYEKIDLRLYVCNRYGSGEYLDLEEMDWAMTMAEVKQEMRKD